MDSKTVFKVCVLLFLVQMASTQRCKGRELIVQQCGCPTDLCFGPTEVCVEYCRLGCQCPEGFARCKHDGPCIPVKNCARCRLKG